MKQFKILTIANFSRPNTSSFTSEPGILLYTLSLSVHFSDFYRATQLC